MSCWLNYTCYTLQAQHSGLATSVTPEIETSLGMVLNKSDVSKENSSQHAQDNIPKRYRIATKKLTTSFQQTSTLIEILFKPYPSNPTCHRGISEMPKVTLTNRSFTATTLVKIFAPWDVQTWNQIWEQHESEVCTVDRDSMFRFGITTYMRVIEVFKQILEYVTHTHILGNLTISCLLSHLPTSCYIRASAVLATLELVHHGWVCSGSRAEIYNPQICICPQSNGSTRHSGQPGPEGKKGDDATLRVMIKELPWSEIEDPSAFFWFMLAPAQTSGCPCDLSFLFFLGTSATSSSTGTFSPRLLLDVELFPEGLEGTSSSETGSSWLGFHISKTPRTAMKRACETLVALHKS